MIKPPDDLKDWSKNDLIRELRRLRAIQRELSEQVHESHSGGDVIDVADDPYSIGGALLDLRGSVLMNSLEVVMIDSKKEEPEEPISIILRIQGRINYSDKRADTSYLFGADGAATLVTELLGLVSRASSVGHEDGNRFASEFKKSFDN